MVRIGRGFPTPIKSPFQFYQVSYDFSNGNFSSGATSITWTHTAALGAGILLAAACTTTTATLTAKWGSTSMTQLTQLNWNNTSGTGQIYTFGLVGAGTGSAVTLTLNSSASVALVAQSVSYLNAAVFVPTGAGTKFGSGTSMGAITASALSNHRVFCAFSSNTTGVLSGFSGGTQRGSEWGGQGTGAAIIMGDAPGSSSPLSFTATSAATTTAWSGAAIDIY